MKKRLTNLNVGLQYKYRKKVMIKCFNTTQHNTTQHNTTQGISIIISTFNRAQFLYATLVCLMKQSIKMPYEVIVVDSGKA